jgi:hypothetical protein
MESIIVLSWAASISFIIYYSLSEKTYLEHVSSTVAIQIPNKPELDVSLISAACMIIINLIFQIFISYIIPMSFYYY